MHAKVAHKLDDDESNGKLRMKHNYSIAMLPKGCGQKGALNKWVIAQVNAGRMNGE